MQIKTILNRVQKFKSFVYGTVRCVEDASVPTLEVEIKDGMDLSLLKDPLRITAHNGLDREHTLSKKSATGEVHE